MQYSDKQVHLTNILNVITRLGNNSFALKGWAVCVVIAIYSFANNSTNKAIMVTLIPLIVIWFLDAYYLMVERKFRKLYDLERSKSNNAIDFNMRYNDISIRAEDSKSFSLFKALISKTIAPFYLICIIMTIVIYFV